MDVNNNRDVRKIIKFGNSSYVVSIPKKWMEKNKLKKGDSVYYQENMHSELMISPLENVPETNKKEVRIDIDGKSDKQIKREIISGYIRDFGKLVITGKTLNVKGKFVRDCLHELVAIEIMEQTNERVIAHDFLNMQDISLEELMRKVDIIVRSMFIDARQKRNKAESENLAQRDIDVNRLTFLIIRVIKKAFDNPYVLRGLKTNCMTLSDTLRMVGCMEKIADALKRIGRDGTQKKFSGTQVKQLGGIYSAIEEGYLKVMKSYYTKNIEGTYEVSENKQELHRKINKLIANEVDGAAIRMLVRMREITDNNVDLARIAYISSEISKEKV